MINPILNKLDLYFNQFIVFKTKVPARDPKTKMITLHEGYRAFEILPSSDSNFNGIPGICDHFMLRPLDTIKDVNETDRQLYAGRRVFRPDAQWVGFDTAEDALDYANGRNSGAIESLR